MKKILIASLLSSALATTVSPSALAQSSKLSGCASIMPLGDSITLGVHGGYRNDLFSGLQQDNCGVTFVGTQYDAHTKAPDKDHEGHSGFTIGDIAREVNGWLAAAQPNIVTLMIGTNDTAWWSADTADKIAARHSALIDQIQKAKSDVWIFVASIAPQSSQIIQPNNIDRAALTAQFNAAVRANVESRAATGQKVRFVDVNSVLTLADLYDGIHPGEAGHAKVAQKFLQAIRAELAATSPAVPASPTPVPLTTPVAAAPPTPAVTPAATQTNDPSPPSSSVAMVSASSAAVPEATQSVASGGGGGGFGVPLIVVLAAVGLGMRRSRADN